MRAASFEQLADQVMELAEIVGSKAGPRQTSWSRSGAWNGKGPRPDETLGDWAYDSASGRITRRIRYSTPGRAYVRGRVAYRQTQRVGRASVRSARKTARVAAKGGRLIAAAAPQILVAGTILTLVIALTYYLWVGARKVEWITGKIVPSAACGGAAVHPAGFLWFGGSDDGRGTSFTDFAGAMGAWAFHKAHITARQEADAVAWVVRTGAKTFVVLQHTLNGGGYQPAAPAPADAAPASLGGCCGPTAAAGSGTVQASFPVPSGPGTNGLSLEQTSSARTIVAVGAGMGVPVRGQVIAVAVALQESSLRNLPGGNGDSAGLFQQRPSWGTLAQRTTPTYAATAFYSRLLGVTGWQTMPLTVAAQTVQVSAYPNAYAQWEGLATQLVGRSAGAVIVPAAFVAPVACTPVPAAVGGGSMVEPLPGSAVAAAAARVGITPAAYLSQPHHDAPGADLAAPTGTPILSVEAGTVEVAGPISGYGSHVVAVRDAAGWLWFYGHGSALHVTVGQQVAAGTQLADVGTEGFSTGPHLHLGLNAPGVRSFGPSSCPQAVLVAAWNHTPIPALASLSTTDCIGPPLLFG